MTRQGRVMFDRRQILWTFGAALVASSGAGCASGQSARPVDRVQRGDFGDIAFADWTEAEPEYLLYPGDEIEVATPTATELTRTIKVGPDGRIALPLIGQAMAADRTLSELEYALSQAYASQLVRPVVEVTLKAAGPMKVWVAGEVRTPGVYDMNGDIDAYQAGRRPAATARRGRGPASRRHPVRAPLDTGRAGQFLYPGACRPADRLQLFDQRAVSVVLVGWRSPRGGLRLTSRPH